MSLNSTLLPSETNKELHTPDILFQYSAVMIYLETNTYSINLSWLDIFHYLMTYIIFSAIFYHYIRFSQFIHSTCFILISPIPVSFYVIRLTKKIM